jgi:benzoylformate decarboxylase
MLDSLIVRDAFFDVLRERGMTTIFSNPGSTEIPLLAGMPGDVRFILALHESSVVGMASGYALGSGTPGFALVHTTAGLGNAVSAIATARVNRIPLVVVAGQQDRRHLAYEPFLTGRLERLAGDYPVWVDLPLRGADVPAAIRRAEHEAVTHRGPALVIVPMDDWDVEAEARDPAAPARVVRADGVDAGTVDELAALLDGRERIGIVVGALAADADTWSAIAELAEHLSAHVWQEAFSSRPGFPQDHRLFAGHVPADRTRLREVLGTYDAVLCLGAPAFRQYAYAEGSFAPAGLPVAVVTTDSNEVHRSAATLAVLAAPAPVCRELVRRLPARTGEPPSYARPVPLDPPAGGKPLLPGHVFDALAARLSRDVVLVEESPSSRVELNRRLPALSPWGYVSAAMGGLGFAFPAATGLRLARPDLPVVAITGDGSALYSIQALWSAAEYRSGALFVVLANGGYAVMDMLAGLHGDLSPPWPGVGHLDLVALAGGFGCEARRIEDQETLSDVLDDVVPGLADRETPLLLEVAVSPEPAFAS